MFWEVFFGVLIAARMTKKINLGQHNFFSKDPMEKRIVTPQS
jgi:hypothetical protein